MCAWITQPRNSPVTFFRPLAALHTTVQGVGDDGRSAPTALPIGIALAWFTQAAAIATVRIGDFSVGFRAHAFAGVTGSACLSGPRADVIATVAIGPIRDGFYAQTTQPWVIRIGFAWDTQAAVIATAQNRTADGLFAIAAQPFIITQQWAWEVVIPCSRAAALSPRTIFAVATTSFH